MLQLYNWFISTSSLERKEACKMELLRNNKWKILFFSLLILNVLIFSTISFRLLKPIEEETEQFDLKLQEGSTFVVRSSKADMNSLINNFLQDIFASTNYSFNVELKDNIHVEGKLPFLGLHIPIYIELEPLIDEKGYLILQLKDMRFGEFDLPNKYALQYIGNTVDLPSFMQIRPEENEIAMSIEQLNQQGTLQFYLHTIDIQTDDVVIEMKINHSM